MKLMIGIPVLDNVSWPFFLYTSSLIGKLSKKYEVILSFPNRCAIDRAREIIVTDAIRMECDRLLFIDDDTIIPVDTVDKLNPLLDREDAVCASGFCCQRGYKYFPMVYRYEDLEWGKGQPQLLAPFPSEPFQVSCVGMGISLLKVSLLKKLQEKLGDCFNRDGAGTEDFYFFKKAYEMKYTTWVHPQLEATHFGNPLWINMANAEELRIRDHQQLIKFLPTEPGGRAQKGLVEI